ncbi:MAG: hypothetical protein C0624_13620, partial [Desulfuromonas sp.]
MQTRAFYYDGQTSTRHKALLTLQREQLIIEGDGFRHQHPLSTLKLEAPIGGLARTLHLADGGSCQISDDRFSAALEGILGSGFQSLVHR